MWHWHRITNTRKLFLVLVHNSVVVIWRVIERKPRGETLKPLSCTSTKKLESIIIGPKGTTTTVLHKQVEPCAIMTNKISVLPCRHRDSDRRRPYHWIISKYIKEKWSWGTGHGRFSNTNSHQFSQLFGFASHLWIRYYQLIHQHVFLTSSTTPPVLGSGGSVQVLSPWEQKSNVKIVSLC